MKIAPAARARARAAANPSTRRQRRTKRTGQRRTPAATRSTVATAKAKGERPFCEATAVREACLAAFKIQKGNNKIRVTHNSSAVLCCNNCSFISVHMPCYIMCNTCRSVPRRSVERHKDMQTTKSSCLLLGPHKTISCQIPVYSQAFNICTMTHHLIMCTRILQVEPQLRAGNHHARLWASDVTEAVERATGSPEEKAPRQDMHIIHVSSSFAPELFHGYYHSLRPSYKPEPLLRAAVLGPPCQTSGRHSPPRGAIEKWLFLAQLCIPNLTPLRLFLLTV